MTKQEKEQGDLFRSDVTWFHIFKEIIRSETWARMSANAKAVYPVIKAFVNWESGESFPSIDTLQQYSGLARASVVKAIKELEKQGLLKKNAAKGKGSTYSLVEQFSVKDKDGNHAASAALDYIPASMSGAIEEFKRVLASGHVTQDGTTIFIKVDNITLNVHAGSGHIINGDATLDK